MGPAIFTEFAAASGDLSAGVPPVPVQKAAQAYVRSIDGGRTGKVYLVE
ncbi:hypothetical protein [Streptomyces sp. NPDC001530]